jgi:hypothetical protein
MVETVIERILSRVTNEVDKSKFSAFYNLIVLPVAQIIEPIERRVDNIERYQGLRSPEYMSEQELDGVASNFLLARSYGTPGEINVKIIVKAKAHTAIPAGTLLTTTVNGISYTFTCEEGADLYEGDFVENSTYGKYYESTFPIKATMETDPEKNYTALTPNTLLTPISSKDPNIAYFILGSISSLSVPAESNWSFYRRMLSSAGSNTLDSTLGIENLLTKNFPSFPVVVVYGNTSEQVTRNKLSVYSDDGNDQYHVMNFKGKTFQDMAVPHKAYDHIMLSHTALDSGNGRLVLGDYTSYMELEASSADYRGLYDKKGSYSYNSGENVVLDADSFLTDAYWTKSDATVGFGLMTQEDEIRIEDGKYLLGNAIGTYDIHRFINDLLNANLKSDTLGSAATT